MFKFKKSSVAPKTETIGEKQVLESSINKSNDTELHVLTVKILEAADLIATSKISPVSGKMPYIVLECDKTQIVLTARDFNADAGTCRWDLKTSL